MLTYQWNNFFRFFGCLRILNYQSHIQVPQGRHVISSFRMLEHTINKVSSLAGLGYVYSLDP
ncbi:MAG: hypothetical protein LBE18_01720 [Planctomycetaceae bacterium]|nr:hypothetical protein [Planctomycetaceae bacterium]